MAAYFIKDVTNYPQSVASTGTIQSILSPDAFAALLETQTPDQRAWLTSGGPNSGPGLYAIRQFQDSPGGEIKGFELSYQQDLTFLPGYLKNLGIQANYTKLTSSDLTYIVEPGRAANPSQPALPAVVQDGPFIGASPKSSTLRCTTISSSGVRACRSRIATAT